MISASQSKLIDLNLVDQIIDRIPEWTWPVVKNRLVNDLVNTMSTTVIERLTGDPTNDERAQEILDSYYEPNKRNKDLIVDSFRIIGEEQTLYSLDALQLDKIKEPTNSKMMGDITTIGLALEALDD